MYDEKDVVRIYGSLAKHFNNLASSTLQIPFYAEGLDDEDSEVYQNTNLSLRVDGPLTLEGSSLTDHRFEVQAFLTLIGKDVSNIYLGPNYAGLVAKSLRGVIPVYDIPSNPSTQVGCLDIDRSSVESVRIVNFGRVSTSSKVRQIAVVARLLYESSDV